MSGTRQGGISPSHGNSAKPNPLLSQLRTTSKGSSGINAQNNTINANTIDD